MSQTECEALVTLYNRTNGPGWTDSTNWLDTTTVDDWYGVVGRRARQGAAPGQQ